LPGKIEWLPGNDRHRAEREIGQAFLTLQRPIGSKPRLSGT
jgi:hypothetical protein